MPSRALAARGQPGVVRAAVGPAAITLIAAGTAVGPLNHSLFLAVVLAAGGWVGRMVSAVMARARKSRRAESEPVDPWSVPPPWRDHLRAAIEAQRKLHEAVDSLTPGPTRDRIGTLEERIDRSVRLAAVTARRGALLTTPERTAKAAALSAELTELSRRPGEPDPAALRHETVVAGQLRAMRRAEAVSGEALDQVRMLATRIDDAVTAVVELSMDSSDMDLADGDPGTLLSVLDEITALHQGMEECGTALDSAGTTTGALSAGEPPEAPTRS